jgi:hypothetical protein
LPVIRPGRGAVLLPGNQEHAMHALAQEMAREINVSRPLSDKSRSSRLLARVAQNRDRAAFAGLFKIGKIAIRESIQFIGGAIIAFPTADKFEHHLTPIVCRLISCLSRFLFMPGCVAARC